MDKTGDMDSHEFWIKESTEYLQYVAQSEEIAALLEEITELRQQNLSLVGDMANMASGFDALKDE
jgi:cell division protein FtsB